MKAKNYFLIATALFLFFIGEVILQQKYTKQPKAILSRWEKLVNPTNTYPEYPPPRLKRKTHTNLSGIWVYAITKKRRR
jgi:hypothetical protein